jgi:hypothetical protein
MKTPRTTAEFVQFDNAMKRILTVSKTELQRRLDAEKTAKKASSRGSSDKG